MPRTPLETAVPLHIALVHRDLHAVTRGGIGTVYRALAPLLAQRGHQLTLITQSSPAPLSLPGIDVITVARTENLDAHRDAVAAALHTLDPDIVESSSWEAETLHYLQLPRRGDRRRRRAPVVIRGDLSAATMGTPHALIAAEAQLLRTADAIVAVSEFAAADLAAAYRIPAPPVLANGVDRARFHPATPAPRPGGGHQIVLGPDATAATRSPLTGPGPLPPPWAPPSGEAPTGRPGRDGQRRARLVWVGKTTPMKGWDRLEHLAGELADVAHITVLLGHAPALCPIRLTGAPDDPITVVQDLPDHAVPDFYRHADYLLSTSRWEGFGLAVAEALACATPVLLPAELGTAPELLAAGGGHTYRDAADLRAALAAPAPPGRLPARFDWHRNAADTLALYQHLTTRPGHQAGRAAAPSGPATGVTR